MPRAIGCSIASACWPRAKARSGRGVRLPRCRREKASSPMTASSTTITTPPKARIMPSKRCGTLTNGSCSSMIMTSAMASTICSATSEPASVAVGTLSPSSRRRRCSTATRPISPRRAGSRVLSRKPMKSAGTTSRVVEAGVVRDRVERGLPDDRLEQDRGQVEHQRREHPPPGDVDVADGAEVDGAQRQLEQHGEEHEPERDAPGRRALGGRLGGELGDGHELVARRVRALHDLGHGLGGLAAVVARAAAVGVVQQQDPARPEADGRAPHDRLDAGLGGVPDALRPADDGVAAARGRARDERVAEPVRRAEEQRMGLIAERALERGLGALELAVDVGLRGEREQRVVVAVGGDLVTLVADAADEVGVRLDMAAEHEEGGAHAARAQRIEHAAASTPRTGRRRTSARARARSSRARSRPCRRARSWA